MEFIIGAYFLWGILAIYWKQLKDVPSLEILAHRILWSFVFLSLITIFSAKKSLFITDIKKIRQQPVLLFWILMATLFLNINWLTYIWAINHNYIVQTSLGYYINPIMTVLLGVLVLQEKLSKTQWISLLFVMTGVIFLTYTVGSFPFISFLLAISFSFYSLIKKKIFLLSLTALLLETLISAIPSIVYIIILTLSGHNSFKMMLTRTTFLLIGSGVVTALPLLLFSLGAKKLPLNLVGVFQYLSPTMTLMIGIFLYHEKFTISYLSAFVVIWFGLFIFISQAIKQRIPIKVD